MNLWISASTICRLDYTSGGEDEECVADLAQVGWVFAVPVYLGCTL